MLLIVLDFINETNQLQWSFKDSMEFCKKNYIIKLRKREIKRIKVDSKRIKVKIIIHSYLIEIQMLLIFLLYSANKKEKNLNSFIMLFNIAQIHEKKRNFLSLLITSVFFFCCIPSSFISFKNFSAFLKRNEYFVHTQP